MATAAMLMATPIQTKAQDWGKLKNMAKEAVGVLGNKATELGKEAEKAATDLKNNLMPEKQAPNPIDASKLLGTWNYSEPFVAMDSNDPLASLATGSVLKKVEAPIKQYLQLAGIGEGKVVLTIQEEGKCTVAYDGKNVIPGSYTLKDNKLTLTVLNNSMTLNAAIENGRLQLSAPADKILALLQSAGVKLGEQQGEVKMVIDLLRSYQGIHLGLRFNRK